MPVPLEYTISILGEDRMRRVLKGIEGEVKASASRVDSVARARRIGSPDQEGRRIARGFDQIGRAARAADYRTIRERMALERTAERQRIRGIENAARAEERALRRSHEIQVRTAQRTGRGFATTLGRGVGKVAGLGGTALAIGGGLLGGLGATSAVEDEIAVRAAASKLANQARRPELKGQLAKEAGGLQGFTRMETLGGLEQFVNLTGDLETARKLLPDLGKLALATGTDLGELAATAGNAFIPIADQIQEPTKRLEVMKDVLAAIAGQGNVGAVEIKDLAKEFAGLAASSNRFAGNKGDILKMMGAIAQAARQRGGAASAAEAVTSVARFTSDLITKSTSGGRRTGAAHAKLMGIDVFTDKTKTQLKNPQELIIDILKKTGGDLTKVGSIFGARGIRAFMGFAPLFTAAEARKKGTGEAAVRGEFARLLGAQVSAPEIQQRAASRLQDEDLRLKEAAKRFNEAVGGQLVPAVTALIPQFTDMLPRLTELAGVLANVSQQIVNHPWASLAVLVGGAIVAEIGKAAIGGMVASAISGLIARVSIAGGATSAAAGALQAGTGAVAAKLGMGAAGAGALAVGVAGAGALAGAGAAGYNALKLSQESESEGGIIKAIQYAWRGPAKATSREEYDRIYGNKPTAPMTAANAPATPQQGTPIDGKQIGADIADVVAQRLATAQVGMSTRRDTSVLGR